VLYVDHTRGAGIELFRLACQLDLEGIVAKRADSYTKDPHWIKVKNRPTARRKGEATCSSELVR
jgi:ATP-dependent DNA ligase